MQINYSSTTLLYNGTKWLELWFTNIINFLLKQKMVITIIMIANIVCAARKLKMGWYNTSTRIKEY
jgi:hypothetical protein